MQFVNICAKLAKQQFVGLAYATACAQDADKIIQDYQIQDLQDLIHHNAEKDALFVNAVEIKMLFMDADVAERSIELLHASHSFVMTHFL